MLEKAAKDNISIAGVMRSLGIKPAGGSHSHIKRMMIQLEVDTSHFTGQGWNKGNIDRKRLDAKSILVYNRRNGRREYTNKLRRALLEIGRQYKCEILGCPVEGRWVDGLLTLQIDHINGDPLDNRAENLRFLCPNCHSQTPTYNRQKQRYVAIQKESKEDFHYN